MNPIKTKVLTRLTFRELTAPQAQGWFCCCGRKTDHNVCGQSRLTISFVFAQFRFGISVATRTAQPIPRAQETGPEVRNNLLLFSRPASYGCHSVLCEGAGQ
jgi:hypothetical protein